MALYRTERRLSWNHSLRIGYWHADFSKAADREARSPITSIEDSSYLGRSLRWLASQYPKARIALHRHQLPVASEAWPEGVFGLNSATDAEHDEAISPQSANANTRVETASTQAEDCDSEPFADDFLLIECPTLSDADTAWANGLERALRRIWQKNAETEVLLIGGPDGLCQRITALAAHYGFSTVDPAALLKEAKARTADNTKSSTPTPANTTAAVANGNGNTDTAAAEPSAATEANALSARDNELWAGLLISALRNALRVGPTPEPVSLPAGLWGNRS